MSTSIRVSDLLCRGSLVGSAAAFGVLTGQTWLARNRIPCPATEAPITDGTLWTAGGVSRRRRPLALALLGDSTAAGIGTDTPDETLAAQLAMRLSAATRRPIRIHNLASTGARTADLRAQYCALDSGTPPDLAVILVGANDVTHRVPIDESTRQLALALHQLRMDDVAVVVATCPDLDSVRPIAEPLRSVVQRQGRALARAQAETTRRAGGVPVSLDLLGHYFTSDPELFAADRYHPPAAGYAMAADVILPGALKALNRQPAFRSAQPRRHLVAA